MKLSDELQSRFRWFSRNRIGATAVEFALSLPVLLLMLFGMIEFGRALWIKNAIQYATERASRCAAMGQTAGATACTSAGATQTYAAAQVTGYTVPSTAFTVTYQCTPTPSAGCTACGVANTKGVLVSATVSFTPILGSYSELLPFERYLSITFTGESCRPLYT